MQPRRKQQKRKTALSDQKLASVGKLEEENAKLKTALDEANKEATRLKKDKRTLTDKVEDIARKRDELENYLGGLAKKLFVMLEGTFLYPTDCRELFLYVTVTSTPLVCAEFCQNFVEEAGWFKTGLDPINSPIKDEAAMNVL